MLNKVILIGNVGADPDVRTMPNGGKVSSFSVATTDYWKDKEGNRRDRTEWHKIVTFLEPLIASVVEPYVKKGSRVYIEGSLRTRKYTDSGGTERYVTEIVVQGFGETIRLLDSRNSSGEQGFDGGGRDSRSRRDLSSNSSGDGASSSSNDMNNGAIDVDDEIPF